ncbi:copper resistance protein B [Sandarakinorhabdus sp. AAP62]|uniref:copper resistance protein B n=1 Tax=Sandarakinorhabdus sp. AAP62 TaxID=1248916 RepID=UPI00031CE2B5|nr:copper resistance protein B [Sandarakinorhabdus sp. AAP62]
MRALLITAALLAAPAAAQKAPDPAHGHDGGINNYTLVEEADITRFDGKLVANWEVQGWIGSDMNKFWWRTEGETKGPRLEQSEFQALYSRNIAMFFDAQVGLRHDNQPDARTYAVVGVQGLAPLFFETEAHAFFGFKGDVLFRLRQSFDLRMTNRLVVQPLFETDIYATRVPERLIAPGPAIIEAGVLTRYEVTRRVAPYVAVMFERRLGESSRLARAAGENPGGWSVRTGVRFWL